MNGNPINVLTDLAGGIQLRQDTHLVEAVEGWLHIHAHDLITYEVSRDAADAPPRLQWDVAKRPLYVFVPLSRASDFADLACQMDRVLWDVPLAEDLFEVTIAASLQRWEPEDGQIVATFSVDRCPEPEDRAAEHSGRP